MSAALTVALAAFDILAQVVPAGMKAWKEVQAVREKLASVHLAGRDLTAEEARELLDRLTAGGDELEELGRRARAADQG